MKKFFLLSFLPVSLFLIGCGTDISYEDANANIQNTIASYLSSFSQTLENTSDPSQIETSLSLQTSQNQPLEGTATLSSQKKQSLTLNEEQESVLYAIDLLDLTTQRPFASSGSIDTAYLSGKYYFKVNDFSLNMGPANAEASFISLFVKQFLGTWIELDQGEKFGISFIDTKEIISSLQKSLGLLSFDVYQNGGEKDFQNEKAYSLVIDPEKASQNAAQMQSLLVSLSSLLSLPDQLLSSPMEIIQFQGYLVPISSSKSELYIDPITYATESARFTLAVAYVSTGITFSLKDMSLLNDEGERESQEKIRTLTLSKNLLNDLTFKIEEKDGPLLTFSAEGKLDIQSDFSTKTNEVSYTADITMILPKVVKDQADISFSLKGKTSTSPLSGRINPTINNTMNISQIFGYTQE